MENRRTDIGATVSESNLVNKLCDSFIAYFKNYNEDATFSKVLAKFLNVFEITSEELGQWITFFGLSWIDSKFETKTVANLSDALKEIWTHLIVEHVELEMTTRIKYTRQQLLNNLDLKFNKGSI